MPWPLFLPSAIKNNHRLAPATKTAIGSPPNPTAGVSSSATLKPRLVALLPRIQYCVGGFHLNVEQSLSIVVKRVLKLDFLVYAFI